ncbi:cation:proton antiporter [Paracoccus sp. p3-h83]|uniref:cation:proton antiporter n=1 Tax=Paracoccus sp. p3-h83 TaxID=3342805 RepID=UPI0035BB7491
MTLFAFTALSAALFVLIALAEPLAARLRVPFAVILAVVGAALGIGAVILLQVDISPEVDQIARVIRDIPIRSGVFLYIFLPTLIFQVSLGLDLRRMSDDAVPILVLAVLAVVVATVVIGYALEPFLGLPLAACLLIGAIVSTTDPSAVVSIFRSIAAPARLGRIVEGESLLNDAAAIALFGFFLTFVMAGVPNPTADDILRELPVLVLGGVAVGWLVARVGLMLLIWLAAFPVAQVTLSLAVPYGAYLIAELAHSSGVIAVVVSGLVLNLMGPGRLAPASWVNLREVWDLLAHWAGSLIFVLAALLIPRLMVQISLRDIAMIGVVVIAAFVARIIILFLVLPLLTGLRLSPRVERPYRLAILWGGLRGAVTLSLALAVTENFRVPLDIKRDVGILATGFTLFTLLVQGTLLRKVIGWLGLDRLSSMDRAVSNQAIAVALQNVREDIAETARDREMTHEIVRAEAKSFAERLDEAVARADSDDVRETDRIRLGLIALAGRERDQVIEAFRDELIPPVLAQRMIAGADDLIEATRTGGRSGYRDGGRRGRAFGRWSRLAVWLYNRLGITGPLARLTGDRFELLLVQRFILRDLHPFIDRRIRRLHGKRVADLLHELLTRREEEIETALAGLRLTFPQFAEEMERRYLRRTALRMEAREYDLLHQDGLIGRESFVSLQDGLRPLRQRADRRPALDLKIQTPDMLARLPVFADLDETARKSLARALRPMFAGPGEMLMQRGERPRRVLFIASGAVEIEQAGGNRLRLGRGEMVGQLSLLSGGLQRANIRAIVHSAFLELDGERFRKLLERHESLRVAVAESARKRGQTVPDLPGGLPPVPVTLQPPEPEPETAPVAAPEGRDVVADVAPDAVPDAVTADLPQPTVPPTDVAGEGAGDGAGEGAPPPVKAD